MAGSELITAFRAEINHYLEVPYFSNVGKFKNSGTNAHVGKGSAKEIALLTVEIANQLNIKLLDFTSTDIYNFQKKHHIGIDCSGLACHLLNFYATLISKTITLDPRKTSADSLTSTPISTPISTTDASTADLIRQKSGHHVVIIVEKTATEIIFVESRKENRKVTSGQVLLSDQQFFKDGIYRLNSFI